MKIGIDARLIEETGVGRYVRNLIEELLARDKENNYVVFLRKKSYESFVLPGDRWEKRMADVAWHGVSEQLVMPWVFLREHLDLVHIPYFNVPIFYPGRFIVTIHDLTILHFDTGKATTLPRMLYKLRRLGYHVALAVGLRNAKRIIAVSQTTKQEIIDHFRIDPDKIVVTYEGVDEKLRTKNAERRTQEKIIKNPYLLYVGNAYPHKNLEMLLRAFQQFTVHRSPFTDKIKIVLVGREDYFYARLKESAGKLGLVDSTIFFGAADDETLANLYAHAVALVLPSCMEGFGLPGLEAMSIGTPVICSDIPVFREIYQDAALFFQTETIDDCVAKLIQVSTNDQMRKQLIKRGTLNVTRYSWRTLAKLTLNAYTNHP